jgi:hypothetical protein
VPVTGVEIAAVGKTAKVVGEKILSEDEKTKDVLLRHAEGTAEMTAAARTMAARTAVVERIKLKVLQPLAFLFGIGGDYFTDTFPQEMAAKMAEVPEEDIVTPSPSVAGPSLLALSYTHSEPSLKDLYLNLLATASNGKRADQAHPAFAEIIKQLSADEAELLKIVLVGNNLQIVRLIDRPAEPAGSYVIKMTHLLPFVNASEDPQVNPRVPTWVDNWIRLGLVNVTYSERASAPNAYNWVESRPEHTQLAASPDITRIDFDKGLLRVTDFGRQFLVAIS